MAINSRAKGARGERMLAKWLRKRNIDARRGQQFSGIGDSPDIVLANVPSLHIECKFVEKINLRDALAQASRDASALQIPAVFHKSNNKDWAVFLDAEDFICLIRQAGYILEPEKPLSLSLIPEKD